MDHVLSCARCDHPIGVHSADGCEHAVRLRAKCTCVYTSTDVVEAALRVDGAARARILTADLQLRAS